MDNNALQPELLSFLKSVSAQNLPLWDSLPDLDLYMDQVVMFMEKHLAIFGESGKIITPSMINNYVKLGVIPPPVKKKYSRAHLARIITISMLKQVLPISALAILTGSSIDGKQPDDAFDRFTKEQCAALNSVCIAVEQDISCPAHDELRAELARLALKLSAQANASRILAEKIASLLG